LERRAADLTFQDFASKKVAGVPILYLLGGGVVILAIVAWKMKPSADSAQAEEAPADAADVAGDLPDPYDGFETKGSVTVAPQPTPDTSANAAVQSNTEWVSKGVQWLVAERNVNGTDAYRALNKFLNDEDRSYEEQQYVDLVFKAYGPPPDQGGGGGSVGPKVATKQFTGSGTHTVMSSNDNTASALAALYYGSNAQDRIDLIEAANLTLGVGPYPTGSKIVIPAYHTPTYFTVQKAGGMTAAEYAALNGAIPLNKLAALNNPKGGTYAPTYRFAKGTRLRVS
jgi:hypothetical protein